MINSAFIKESICRLRGEVGDEVVEAADRAPRLVVADVLNAFASSTDAGGLSI